MTNRIANAFTGTFAFLPTLDPTQKKQKSLQATAQGQCKLDTIVLRPNNATSANNGFVKLGVQWLIEHLCFALSSVQADSFVLRNPQLHKPEKRYRIPCDRPSDT